MTSLDLAGLARTVTAPAAAVRGARHLSRGALSNAARSLEELRRAVTDRFDLAVSEAPDAAGPGELRALGAAECWQLLSQQRVGRLAYVARAGRPEIVPVNYAVEDHTVLLRSGVGPKLEAARRRDNVAFEVDEVDDVAESGWSVVVYGRAELVPLEDAVGAFPAPWATGPRHHLVRIVPERITGRRLHGIDG